MAAVPPLTATRRGVPSSSPNGQWQLKLGPFSFANPNVEHPQALPFPLEQQIAVHQQAGGTRTVQTFGAQPGPITFTGTLYYNGAVAEIGQLRAVLTAGKTVQLSWGPLQWDVIVQKVEPEAHHQFEIAYSVTCIVVRDKTGHATLAAQASLDAQNQALWDQMQTRFANLQALDPTTSSWAGDVASAGGALQSASPVSAAGPSQIQSAISSVQTVISSVQPYVGVLRVISTQIGAQQLFAAQGMLSNLQLILANLGSGNPAKAVTVLGTSLADLAATHYGDPSLWTVIAAANGLWSMHPLSTAPKTVKIPPNPGQNTSVPT